MHGCKAYKKSFYSLCTFAFLAKWSWRTLLIHVLVALGYSLRYLMLIGDNVLSLSIPNWHVQSTWVTCWSLGFLVCHSDTCDL